MGEEGKGGERAGSKGGRNKEERGEDVITVNK